MNNRFNSFLINKNTLVIGPNTLTKLPNDSDNSNFNTFKTEGEYKLLQTTERYNIYYLQFEINNGKEIFIFSYDLTNEVDCKIPGKYTYYPNIVIDNNLITIKSGTQTTKFDLEKRQIVSNTDITTKYRNNTIRNKFNDDVYTLKPSRSHHRRIPSIWDDSIDISSDDEEITRINLADIKARNSPPNTNNEISFEPKQQNSTSSYWLEDYKSRAANAMSANKNQANIPIYNATTLLKNNNNSINYGDYEIDSLYDHDYDQNIVFPSENPIDENDILW